MIQKACLCVHVIPIHMCGPCIALVLFDGCKWLNEIVNHNAFDVKDFCLLTKGTTTCEMVSRQSFKLGIVPLYVVSSNVHDNYIGTWSILPLFPDELFLEKILKVILEGIFDETRYSNFLREWDPLKIILSIWTPKSHVRLINIRLIRRVAWGVHWQKF